MTIKLIFPLLILGRGYLTEQIRLRKITIVFLTLDSLEDKEDQRWTSEVVSVRDEKMLEPTPEGIQLDLSSIESYQMNFIPVEIEGHQVDSIPLSHLFHCDVTEESSQDVILKLRRKVVRRIFI